MNFFLDENIPKAIENILVEKGYTVFDVRKTDKEGLDDKDIFELAQQKNAIFLTTDKDFFHTIPFLFDSHHGIIVIALRQPDKYQIIKKIKFVLQNIDLLNIKNKVLLLKDNQYSIYTT